MSAKPRAWYRMQADTTDASVVHIHIIDIIGDWIDELINEYWGMKATVTAKAFVDQLAQLPETVKAIKVHINSPGGDVFAALNIANALRDQQTSKARTVETIVDGLAASAASIIMMAGKTVTIADNAMVMIHNPWTSEIGNAAALRKTADTLDAIRNTIVATYKWHSSLETEALNALMDADTWMDADEAIANGFATQKIDGLTAAASIDPKVTAKLSVPDRFKDRVKALLKPEPAAPVVASSAEVLAAVDAAGLGVAFARDLLAQSLTGEQVNARIQTETRAKAAAAARATDIRALCAVAKLPELADGYIKGGMSVADVRVHMTTVTAKVHEAHIDTGLQPDRRTSAGPVNLLEIYGKLNGAQA
jgi:ATP-dependent protease ClpP protease subunit